MARLSPFENEAGDLYTGAVYLRDAMNRVEEAQGHFEDLLPKNSPILQDFLRRLDKCYNDLAALRSEAGW